MNAPAFSYPAELVGHVLARWPAEIATPDASFLGSVLETAYHASFLRDEERPVTFRLLLAPPEALDDRDGPPWGLHRMRFDHPRAFDPHELRRLAPAVKFHRALIGVSPGAGGLPEVWGFAQSGPRWLQAAWGGRANDVPMPAAPVVRVARPGQVAIACGALPIAELANGVLVDLALDVFHSDWLAARFAPIRGELAAVLAAEAAGPPVAPELLRTLAQQMLRRVIATIRSTHHGGTLLIVPNECATRLGRERVLELKYSFADEAPRRRYRAVLLTILRELTRVARETGSPKADWELYRSLPTAEITDLDEALFELSATLAAMADVDGAVVVNKHFEVLGFGAEIGGDLPHVDHVARALDLEGRERITERVDAIGTRHRSVYRLCARFHEALAIVVAQDGGVRFVAHHDGAVTYWDHGTGSD